jgi:hypothetical protein
MKILLRPMLVFLLCLPFLSWGQAEDIEPSKGDYFIGPFFTYSKRPGHIDFDSVKKSVAVAHPDIFTAGLSGGIRLPLGRLLRLQVGLCIDAGNAIDDTLYTTQPALDKYYYYHAALEPALLCALVPAKSRVTPFLALGAGVNAMWVNERTFLLDKPAQEVIFTDRYYINEVSWSASGFAGLGINIAINSGIGISLSSSFRYLYPVSWKIQEDFPLYAMRYTESQYGNVTWLGIYFAFK